MSFSVESQTTKLPTRTRLSIGKLLLWIIIGLALLYSIWIAFDLFTHPFEAGANRTIGSPYLFRWLSFSSGIFTLIIALLILRKVSGNPVGPLLILWGVGNLGWSHRVEYSSPDQAALAILIFSLYFFCLASPAVVLLLFYFPTGKNHPAWLNRWIVPSTILMGISGLLLIIGSPGNPVTPNPLYRPGFEFGTSLYSWTFVLFAVGAMVSLALRYRQGSRQERLQLRWFLWLLAIVILSTLIGGSGAITRLLGPRGDALSMVILFILWQSFAGVAIGIAMLRHRLWDIDIIIRRTLVYGGLTATIAIIYFGSVVLLQELFQVITGQHQSQITTVISTLGIAVLFTPLRRRIQLDIDRRFYRKKYNAEQILINFAARARDEMELEQLAAHLVKVVQETMQPEYLNLWMKPVHSPQAMESRREWEHNKANGIERGQDGRVG